jgi:hypothetical protein
LIFRSSEGRNLDGCDSYSQWRIPPIYHERGRDINSFSRWNGDIVKINRSDEELHHSGTNSAAYRAMFARRCAFVRAKKFADAIPGRIVDCIALSAHVYSRCGCGLCRPWAACRHRAVLG